MAKWTGVITNAGNSLLGFWVNEKTLRFDRATAGTGTVEVVALMAQTGLVGQKQEASILGAEAVSGGIRLKLRITAPEEAYTLNQYGVWASVDGGESVLVALFQHEQGVSIPSREESPDFVYTFYALILCSNTGAWTVNLDTSALVSVDDMNEAIASEGKKYLPLQGGCMAGSISMGGNKITGLGTPTDAADAVPKSYADAIRNTAQAALPKSGGAMSGDIAMAGHKVTGLGTPTEDSDAVPKSYVVARKELASMSHSQLDANGNVTLDTITAYPTSPGVYRVGPAGDMPVPGAWGNLIIYNSGYVTHIFENGDGFWVQRTEYTSGVTKDNWRRLPAMKTTTATILASSWSGNNAWAAAAGVKTTSTVIVSPAYGNRDNYINYGLMCISQPADGYLEFYCDTVPGVDITVNVLILD